MSILVKQAGLKDIDSIHNILKPYAEKGIILERTKDEIVSLVNQFYIAEKDNNPIGVISYHDYDKGLIEIRSLAVKSEYFRAGVGSKLLKKLISVLKNKDTKKIFVLTYLPQFFKKHGFIEVEKDTLAEKIWKDCYKCKDRDNCGETALILPD